ncbi:MAG: M48 family peptidase [Gammaproteobacteria bacterium]|nr:MAG: M48 family peptidase [Gammaproteobacteria bacterium]
MAYAAAALAAPSGSNDIELPVLGDTSSAMISPVQEKILGQRVLKAYRAQVPTSSDPLVIDYLEGLINRLLPYSQLDEKRIDLVVVKNDTLNAFAVPGGVMGIHTGVFNYAKSENQLAAIISHEMGHLSQRHYARHLEQQKNSMMPMIAGMLAGLVLAANSNGDGGMAAIMASQAAAEAAALRFSRENEQEADRIGMQTMLDAKLDPYAASDMFEEMLHATRSSRRPPEYLLTHPVTERRVADARNRAMSYPRKAYTDNLEFQLMRSRIRFELEETPQTAIKRFKNELDGDNTSPDASRYGLALAYSSAGQFDAARTTLKPLLEKDPTRITYLIMSADIDVAAERYKPALDLLSTQLALYPESYPLNIRYAEASMKAGRYKEAAELLEKYSRKRKNDDYLWYLLAEVDGLNGDILGVHEARAEYFIANGVYDKAMAHLRNAIKLAKGNFQRTSILEERLKYVEHEMMEMRS